MMSKTSKTAFMKNPTSIPELPPHTIHVWRVHIPDMRDRIENFYALLSEDEQKKAQQLQQEKSRNSSIIARGVLRTLLSGYLEIPATEIVFQYSKNGKPSLDTRIQKEPISFNISHSNNWILLAFGRHFELGIDIEKIQPQRQMQAIASRYFSPKERERLEKASDFKTLFFQLWAKKEAYVKASDSTLFQELRQSRIPLSDGKDKWHLQSLEIDPQYAAALVSDKRPILLEHYHFG